MISDAELLQRRIPTSEKEIWLGEISDEIRNAFDLLENVSSGVSVFGSARVKPGEPYYELGVAVGQKLAERGFEVITGGGPGLMEAANRGAALAGGTSIGLGIELPNEQGFNEYVNLPVPFEHFFTRKLMFVRYACGYVSLPGGFGTMDELFEALTLIQTGKIRNFPVVLIGSEFWTPMHAWLREQLLAAGTISEKDLDLVTITDDLDEMASVLHACRNLQRGLPY